MTNNATMLSPGWQREKRLETKDGVSLGRMKLKITKEVKIGHVGVFVIIDDLY